MKSKAVELKNDGKQLERFTDLMKTLVSASVKDSKAAQSNDEPLYIVLDGQICVYRLKDFDKNKNVAHLTIYRTLLDFAADKPLRTIKVEDWQ